MSGIIKDGVGQGHAAKVDNENRLHTHAYTVTIEQSAAINGDVFGVSSGVINLTSANESAVYYIKNNTQDDILILEQFLLLGASTGGDSDNVTIKYYIGATGGDIISTATEMAKTNRRFLDSNVLEADAYSGIEGATVSGGTESSFISAGFINTGSFIIPKGIAMGISITPSANNTSQDITFGLNLIKDASSYAND